MPAHAHHALSTEQAIRSAAIELIARNGYESMSLRQLASQAGINTGTLYLYYQGKQDLLVSLVLSYFEALRDAWHQARPAGARADELLRAFTNFHVRYHLLKKEEGLLGNMELRSLNPQDLETVRQARRAYLVEIQAMLEQGLKEGCMDCDDPKLLAQILFNMLSHTCSWYRADGPLAIEQVVARYTQLVLRMVGCPARRLDS